MQLPKQYTYLEDDLQQIDHLLLEKLSKVEDPIRTASIQLVTSGGKRTRPLLCMISSYFGERSQAKPYQLAAVLELIHMSSLIHDDIIDHAPLRRGVTTIHELYNNQSATFMGDYLFAQGLELMAEIRNVRAHQIFSETLRKLSIGELEQLENRYQINRSLKSYLRKNRNKTARLIAVSCQLGALATHATESIQQTLYWFGYYLGMSYQIIDDILDFTDRNQKLGKLNGQDLAEGYLTLPTLLAIKDKKLYDKVQSHFHQLSNGQTVELKTTIDEIKQTGAIEMSYQFSQWYLNQAMKKVNQLPNQVEKQLLLQMIGYLGKRNY
ncbi:polyprenyl synthetase family protein [Amphibacillus sp. Q70]|uniref:polyprenyl synthetase family protein n=1 Tax=Amphibacillus sp. Q70 TaxID=3453416 RepID=UPI003F880221